MLSRRNIRIKVMQSLYAYFSFPETSFKEVEEHYLSSINKSFSLYLFSLVFLREVLKYFKVDTDKKLNRKIKQDDDLISMKLYDSPEAQSIITSEDITRLVKDYDVENEIDQGIIRKFYNEFVEGLAFIRYSEDNLGVEEVMLALFKAIQNNETTQETLVDKFPNWMDDDSLIKGAIKKTIRSLPLEDGFHKNFLPEKEKTVDLGVNLLYKTWTTNEEIQDIVYPRIRNWDPKRVARIDMILIKMAVAEFIHFDSVPTAATINEYIEVSKLYSTPKSKEFVNGVLDRIVNDLKREDKINPKKI